MLRIDCHRLMLSPLRMVFLWMSLLLIVGFKSCLINFSNFGIIGNIWFKEILKLKICEWMVLQKDIKLQAGDYAVHLDIISKLRSLNSIEKFLEDMSDQMRDRDACTSFLHSYLQNKLSDKAEALFKRIGECGFLKSCLSYNHMLSMYISKQQFEKVLEIIKEFKSKASYDIVTYNLWLTAFASGNDVQAAGKVFLNVKEANLNPD